MLVLVDFRFLIDLRYNLHGGWESPQETRIHGALYRGSNEPSWADSVDGSILLLLEKGVPAGKIMLGIP